MSGPVWHDDQELIAPRADERLDVARLAPWLRERLPRTAGPLEIRQFGGGRANLTYLLHYQDAEYVLRRPPLGPIAPGSHDMAREHRVLSRLWAHFDLAPRCFVHCEDPSLIGAPFQVMERRTGRVLRKPLPPDTSGDPALARRIGEMVVDVLAALHGVDRDQAGLGDLGRPHGFVQRQLEGWAKRWAAAAHAPNPAMDGLIGHLRERLPDPGRVTLLHNDYKLDNLLVAHDDPARCVAVLDWDMSTSGDPLLDLGYLLNQWAEPGDRPEWIAQAAMPTEAPGFMTRNEVVERYARTTGFDLRAIDWYVAFACMKFAVILQQIYIRWRRGQTRDARFADYGERAATFIGKGLHHL